MKYSGRWAFLTFLLGCASAAAQPSCSSSVTGTAVPALAALDTAIQAPLSKYNIPGASLAVSYKGRLVFARGYGCGNKSSNTPVLPGVMSGPTKNRARTRVILSNHA
jgi:CubicO group peptidase (beta-lactamase class C family)